MTTSKPQKRFRNFIFDSSIPGGIRIILSIYMILAFYFFIISLFLSVLSLFNSEAVSGGLFFVTLYSLACFLFLSSSIYPLWSGRFSPRFFASVASFLIVGYGAVWFFVEIMFAPLAFVFILIGGVCFIYILTGRGPRFYYQKSPF